MKTYGYCRISRKTQDINRQVRNIKEAYPEIKDADIFKEAFTGTKISRPEFDKLLRVVKSGDTIVFDSVSRMSRNAEEGYTLYQDLYSKGVELIFLKEGYINTETYKTAMQVAFTGNEIADVYIEATNKVLMILAEQQIKKAFEQAQKEVDDLHQRTAEGIETARLNGKQIGQVAGAKLNIKKKQPMMEQIKKLSRDFDGQNTDSEVIKITGLARNTYYKYKRELTQGE